MEKRGASGSSPAAPFSLPFLESKPGSRIKGRGCKKWVQTRLSLFEHMHQTAWVSQAVFGFELWSARRRSVTPQGFKSPSPLPLSGGSAPLNLSIADRLCKVGFERRNTE